MKTATILKGMAAAALLALAHAGANAQMVDHSPAKELVEIDVHVLGGGSGITQNYRGAFGEITELNSSIGASGGAGAGAVFGLRQWFGFGTELNVVFNNNKLNMAVTNDDVTSVSNIFIKNHYIYLDIPVYVSFRFNVLHGLRWNIDAGMYYRFGIAGHQDQTIYNSTVNGLGQLVPQVVTARPGYFHNTATFINSYNRGDIGLHLATGLRFGRHFTIGVRAQFGLKNVAKVYSGVTCPRIHNFSLLASVGYKF